MEKARRDATSLPSDTRSITYTAIRTRRTTRGHFYRKSTMSDDLDAFFQVEPAPPPAPAVVSAAAPAAAPVAVAQPPPAVAGGSWGYNPAGSQYAGYSTTAGATGAGAGGYDPASNRYEGYISTAATPPSSAMVTDAGMGLWVPEGGADETLDETAVDEHISGVYLTLEPGQQAPYFWLHEQQVGDPTSALPSCDLQVPFARLKPSSLFLSTAPCAKRCAKDCASLRYTKRQSTPGRSGRHTTARMGCER